MKVAIVAPLIESVPPKFYGGTERMISWLTEELVVLGEDVTLFASGDSVTTAHLIPCAAQALRLDPKLRDPCAYITVELEIVAEQAHQFDFIHWHLDYQSYPIANRLGIPHATTLHGRLDLPELVPVYHTFPHEPVVSISNAQRAPFPSINWQGTVYHGLPVNLYELHDKPGDYLAFLGRIAPEKGVDSAIEIAKKTGMKLMIAAKVDRADEEYYEKEIKPLMDPAVVEYIGEISEDEKGDFLGNAYATLFPVDWPEPFGIVMTESMACGTPIVAFAGGSVAEVMEEGVTGFIVKGVPAAVQAIGRISQVDRQGCRRYFEERFTVNRMAKEYLAIYRRLIQHPLTRSS